MLVCVSFFFWVRWKVDGVDIVVILDLVIYYILDIFVDYFVFCFVGNYGMRGC